MHEVHVPALCPEVEPLSAADCLADVERRIDRGADGASVEKKTVGAEVCHFALGEREVVMRVAGPFLLDLAGRQSKAL